MSQANDDTITILVASKTRRKRCREKTGRCDIYVVTNLVNGKKYVGMTTSGYEKRWREHLLDAKACRWRSLLHRAIRKYGETSFVIEVVATATNWQDLCSLEVQFIRDLNTFKPNGYNATHGGDGVVGYIPTEDEVKKRAERNARQALDPVWLASLREGIKQNIQNPVWRANVTVANRIKGDVRIALTDANDPDRKERRVYQRTCDARTKARRRGEIIPKQNFVAAQAIIDASDAADPEGAEWRARQRQHMKNSIARRKGIPVPYVHALAIAEQDELDPEGADRRRRIRESRNRSARKPASEKLSREQKSANLDAIDPAGIERRRKGRIRDKLRPARNKLVPRKPAID